MDDDEKQLDLVEEIMKGLPEGARVEGVQFTPVCRRCHRPLSDPKSVEAGIGPVCVGKEHSHD